MVEPGVADGASGKDSDVLLKRYTTPSRIDDNSHALREVAPQNTTSAMAACKTGGRCVCVYLEFERRIRGGDPYHSCVSTVLLNLYLFSEPSSK